MHRPIAKRKINSNHLQRLPTYYELPVLKKSDYLWKVGVYIYVGGLAAGAQLIATAAALFGIGSEPSLLSIGRGIAFFAALVGGLILISHLHVPQRFHNMLRIFRPTSSMSIGVYLLLTFSFFSGITFVADLVGFSVVAFVSGAMAAMLALGMATYTAPLLATTATPLWSAAPLLLAVRFAAAAIASAASLLSAIAFSTLGERTAGFLLAEIALVAISIELIAALFWQLSVRLQGVFFTPWDGREGSAHFLLLIAAGALPIILYSLSLTASAEWMAFFASFLVVAGGPFMRVLILHAGNQSAVRPRDYFRMTGSAGRDGVRKVQANAA